MSVYGNFIVDLSNPNSTWTIIQKAVKKHSKVLDIGCSSGYFAEVLIKQNDCVVDGVEIDENDARRARSVCRNVYEVNAEQTDFVELLDEKYDYIIFADVLEHLLDPSTVLKNISKVLKPDGVILFSIPNMAHGSVRLQLLQGNFDYENEGILDRTHLHFYTKKTISEMVKKSGLHIHSLDATTFDLPQKIIEDVLKNVGLESTNEFNKFITSGDALAYQYIGLLKKSKTGEIAQSSLDNALPILKPKLSYENELATVQADARDLFKRLKLEEERVAERDAQIALLSSKLHYDQSKLGILQRIPVIKAVRGALKPFRKKIISR